MGEISGPKCTNLKQLPFTAIVKNVKQNGESHKRRYQLTKDSMNEAIKLAIEKGGYKFKFTSKKEIAYFLRMVKKYGVQDGVIEFDDGGYDYDPTTIHVAEITQDPLFWQSLGKALGWAEEYVSFANNWRTNWHRYIDCLAENGDTEKFWEELLTAK